MSNAFFVALVDFDGYTCLFNDALGLVQSYSWKLGYPLARPFWASKRHIAQGWVIREFGRAKSATGQESWRFSVDTGDLTGVVAEFLDS